MLSTWISNNGAKGSLTELYRDYIIKVSFDPSFADARPTSTSCWFYGMSYLATIENLEKLNTEEVTDMSYMFSDCSVEGSSITTLDLRSFNTGKVKDMSGMFSSSDRGGEGTEEGLTSLDLSSFNTEQVRNMSSMFGGRRKFTTLDLSGFNTINVEDMSGMFKESLNITELDLSSFNTENVKNMAGLFAGCNNLASLKFGETFTTANVTDMSNMFSNCKVFNTLDLSGFNTANVTNMSGMFDNCYGLTSLNLSSFNTANVTDMSGMFENCYNLTALDLSSFNTANVKSMKEMFYVPVKNSVLSTITFGNNFNTSNVTDMSYMFYGCNGLTELDLSKFNTENVTTMYYMFYGCSGLTTLNLSNFKTEAVTTMYGMFYGCSNLQTLDINNFNTENVTTMESMFKDCKSLTVLDLSRFNTAKVIKMSDMFNGCSNLQTLDLSSFDTEKVTFMSSMFQNCSKLVALDICNFKTNAKTTTNNGTIVNTLKNIRQMFGGCTSLRSLNLGNNDFKDVNYTTTAFGGKVSNINTDYVTNCNLIVGTGFDKSVLGTADETSGLYTWLNGTFTLQPLTVDEENKGAFTAGTVSGIEYEKVVLKRTFNTGAWNTLVVPFDITAEEAEAAFGGNVKIANYKGATENANGYTLNFEQVETESAAAVSPTVITAHTPVFIYGVTPSTDGYTFTNKTIKVGTPTQKADKVDFVGTYTAGNVAVGDYFIAADNNFYRAADASNTIRATRATFRPVGTASAAKIAGFVIDGETTAINQPAMTGTAADGAAYNLQGQRVGNGYKGVVIQNGRKYVRK